MEEKKIRRTRKVREAEETKGRKLAKLILNNYDISSITDIEDALKDLLGDTIKEMLEAEFENHIETPYYKHNETRTNYRNGYKTKTVNSTRGPIELTVPQDKNSTFEPEIVSKRQRDISNIETKIISMYARGMSNKDISDTVEEIYGFEVDEALITNITNKIIPIAQEWKSRPLEKVYPVVFIDATHFSVKEEGKVSKNAAYIILGIDSNGMKDVLSIEIGENENSKFWLSVLTSLKARGVKDILILCSDRLTGIQEAISAVYPRTDWQGCIVHQVRNTLKYVSYKHKKEFAKDLKLIYTANTEEDARMQLDYVSDKWNNIYKGSMDRWYDNWDNILPMFSYGEELRRIVYTTNAIESLNASYKRINKGRVVFPSKMALFKALYLATENITKKWSVPTKNWGQVYAELVINFGRDRLEI